MASIVQASQSTHRDLVELAVSAGADPEAATQATATARSQNRSPIQLLIDLPGISEAVFLRSIADSLGLPFMEAPPHELPRELATLIPSRMAITYGLVPVSGGTAAEDPIDLCVYDPFDLTARQAMSRLNRRFRLHLAPRGPIHAAVRAAYGIGAETFDELLATRTTATVEPAHSLLEETNVLDSDDSEASVVKFVNQIINAAIDDRATDIHIEPLVDDLRIRYRIDGVLQEATVPQRIKELQDSLISRIKIMANLDIAERRLPQDGRMPLQRNGKAIDVRVATIPSVTGESVSLRLLGQEKFDFRKLGLEADDERRVRSLLDLPNGIILLTGPTGCGKSTTLYTFLSQLNTRERRIVTIEDPVEQKLPGVVQIAVKHEIKLGFAEGLRSILRSDPNVIMVGEMRDFETAEIAIRAALTGHLVFSTLHTNDATGGITRLVDMEIEPFLVASSVRAFLAQRLVRLLCPACKTSSHHAPSYLDDMGFPATGRERIYGPVGCEKCRMTGYVGRRAIYEICLVSDAIQELITTRAPGAAIRQHAIREGMVPLRTAGWKKVLSGLTSIEEVVRVTTADVDTLDE